MTTEALTRTEPLARPAVASLPYDPRSASAARKLIRDKLAEWELDHLVQDAELVVTELVSNATKTGCLATMQVGITRTTNRTGPAVRVAVRDCSRALPVLVHTSRVEESGRGLAIVDNLSVVWGVDLDALGKTVWSELSVKRA